MNVRVDDAVRIFVQGQFVAYGFVIAAKKQYGISPRRLVDGLKLCVAKATEREIYV